jgi:tetratricopeptide (TPR) repeat protein
MIARHNRAIELRLADRSADALSEIEALLRTGFDAPETALLQAHLLGDLGLYDEGVAAYRTLLARWPDLIDGHETLCALLPQIGRREEALQSYRYALAQRPDIGALWVSALGAAKNLRDASQLIDWCDQVERRFGSDSMVTTFRAQALSWQGEDGTASALLQQAIPLDPQYQPMHTTLAHVALRQGDAELAKRAALQAAQLAPDEQTAWALLSVALRLLDDPLETWLADYDHLVRVIDLDGLDLAATTQVLTALHSTGQHPAEQSLRGGTQTRGNLFEKHHPEIVALQDAISVGIAETLPQFRNDPQHPFLRRNTGKAQFAGSWSVRLRSQGFHVSHIHHSGWISSACYISLPSEMKHGDVGALTFGFPDAELGLDLPPRRIVRPQAGQLVLFPSYMWHGTIPFESREPRLTIAFDALPA